MNSACRQHELEILSRGGDLAAPAEELRLHLADCAACTSLAERISCETSLLRSLARLGVPGELDGRVVASLHAGHREERAAAAVARLTRTRVPEELERALARRPGDPATPAVLERLVAEDLRDPSKALSRRFAGRLPRLRAPEELDRRVEAIWRERAPVQRRRWTTLSMLGGVLLALAGGLAWWSRDAEAPAPPAYRFTVRYLDSVEALGPEARTLVAALSGGASEVSILRPETRKEQPR